MPLLLHIPKNKLMTRTFKEREWIQKYQKIEQAKKKVMCNSIFMEVDTQMASSHRFFIFFKYRAIVRLTPFASEVSVSVQMEPRLNSE